MRLSVFSPSLFSLALSSLFTVHASARTPADFDEAAPSEAPVNEAPVNEAAPTESSSTDTSSMKSTSTDATDATSNSEAETPSDERPVALDAASSTPSAPVEDQPPPVFEPSPVVELRPSARRRASPEPDESKLPTPFDRNSIRVGATAGWAGSATTDWFVLGVGLGYFVLDGLEVHADSSFWLGGNPFIATVTPGVRYVFHWVPQVKPYVGAFYRHYFVDRVGYDSDSLGGRVGLYFTIAPQVYFGGGIVYERMLDDHLFRQRDQVYPELSLAFTF